MKMCFYAVLLSMILYYTKTITIWMTTSCWMSMLAHSEPILHTVFLITVPHMVGFPERAPILSTRGMFLTKQPVSLPYHPQDRKTHRLLDQCVCVCVCFMAWQTREVLYPTKEGFFSFLCPGIYVLVDRNWITHFA